MEWSGRVVVITGASRGIGRELAIDLVEEGALVAVLARSPSGLEATVQEAKERSSGAGECIAWTCDVTQNDTVEEAVSGVVARWGRIDVVVCNAGIGSFKSPVDASFAEMHRVMDVNLWGAVRVVKAALPHMIDRRSGHLVFVGSVGGKHGFPRQAAYSASKFALLGFAESLSLDVEAAGIHVSIVNPGPVDTPFFEEPGLEGLRQVSAKHAIPASKVSRAIRQAVGKRSVEVTVPPMLRLPGIARQVVPSLFRRGLRLFARRNGLLWQPATPDQTAARESR